MSKVNEKFALQKIKAKSTHILIKLYITNYFKPFEFYNAI